MPPATKTPPADPAADASKATAQSPNDLVRVYNRSRKQFTHSVYPKPGEDRSAQVDYISAPNAFITIPRWLADLWVKNYPAEMLPGDSALKTLDAGAAELLEAKEKLAAFELEKAALADELAETKRQLAEARGSG